MWKVTVEFVVDPNHYGTQEWDEASVQKLTEEMLRGDTDAPWTPGVDEPYEVRVKSV